MVAILDSGLSETLVTPTAAAFMLPAVRALPAWYGWMVNVVSNPQRNDDNEELTRFQQLGKTDVSVTNAGNRDALKVYKALDELDASHGLSVRSG